MRTDNKSISYKGFIWNALYAGINALQSAVFLFVVSRTRMLSDAGIVTFGFTLAALAMILARYGIRNYQVTDVHEEFSFLDYFRVRLITVVGTLLFFTIFLLCMIVLGKYSLYKGCIILELIAFKLIDAFEDVYVGRFQQKGRLEVGAKIASVRILGSTVIVFLLLWIVDSIPICLLIGIIISVIIDFIMLSQAKRIVPLVSKENYVSRCKRLLVIALPLCIGTALHNYIGNAPKYLVDLYISDDVQAISGYVMMPMFIISIINVFFMQPMVKNLGDAWNTGGRLRIRRMIICQLLVIITASLIVLGLGVWFGLRILSWIFKVDLRGYRNEFCELMVGGMFYTISAYMIVLLTTIRKQKWIIAGCLFSIVIYLLFGHGAIYEFGFSGATLLYIISNLAMLLVYICTFWHAWKKTFYGGNLSC